jgi:hypothetical protein
MASRMSRGLLGWRHRTEVSIFEGEKQKFDFKDAGLEEKLGWEHGTEVPILALGERKCSRRGQGMIEQERRGDGLELGY